MARTNRTRFAILGMLTSGPRSGYDLKQDFETQISHFWSESLGQIYPMLHRLRDEGLVTARTTRKAGRPPRTVYTITAAGRSAFRTWLAEPAAPDALRNELLLKLFFGPEMSIDQALEHVDRFEERQRELRSLYRHFEDEIDRLSASPTQHVFWKLALSSGAHVNRARLAWCKEARATLEAERRNQRRRKVAS